jgi:LPPG:FO 2-phospho-L-lactate transferase
VTVSPAPARNVVALAGGVGAARFLRGFDPDDAATQLTAVVNTGDDCVFYGVHVSPDIDIVSYTLAGLVDSSRGYGLAGDTFTLVDQLGAFGHEIWFRLGDRDFATCQHRTLRLAAGAGLAEVTDDIRRRLGVAPRILPMSEDPCPTIVELEGGRHVHFEEYLARDGAPDEVVGVDLSAARAARPGPGVLDALADAELILLCPSNPVVSIGPILAVNGVEAALRASPAPVVAVSPIVGGAPIKGPADRLLRGLGHEVSALGVAALYGDLLDGFVLDERDAASRDSVAALGLEVRVTDTIMRDVDASRRLVAETLALAVSLQ